MRERIRTGEQEQGAAEHIADGPHDGVRLAGTVVIVGLDALRGFGSEIFAEIAILLATTSFALAGSAR